MIAAAARAWEDERWAVLGGGSNTLAGDQPFDGTVVLVRSRGIEVRDEGSHVVVTVQAGEDWDALVALAVEQGWAGIEALSGIPGTVGAAPVQNIGAYGQEVAETVTGVEFFDAETGELEWLRGPQLGFGYRASAFKRAPEQARPDRIGVVLAVEFRWERAHRVPVPTSFPQLAEALGQQDGGLVALAQIRETVLRLRAAKGMVFDPNDPDTRSLGSFFLNPVVPLGAATSLPADAPRYPIASGTAELVIPLDELAERAYLLDQAMVIEAPQVKLSAAWLIEHSGIPRGYALHGSRAAVSSKHSLALTNRGGASAEEIAQLARFIQQRVQAEFGIWLQPEPVCLNLEL